MIFLKDIFSLTAICLSFIFLTFFVSTSDSIAAEEDSSMLKLDTLRTELSSRHVSYSKQSLIDLMGSEDALVEGLLFLRRESKPPALGIRAEKLLLAFSSRKDVRDALVADVEDPEYFGLGSVVVSSLNQIEDSEFRKFIAKKSLATNNLKSSSHSRYKAIIDQLDPNLLK